MSLEVIGLSSGYGQIQVLKDVSLTAKQGRITCIVGPNGAGKSTILKTIFGFIKPIAGEIRYAGKTLLGFKPHEMPGVGLAYMPQGRSIFPNMTVLENLKVGAYPLKDKEKRKENLEKVFRLFPQLKEKRMMKAGHLSGGEQRMVEFGRMLMVDPKMILMDEPSVGLAPVIAEQTYNLITTIKETGKTFLIADQNIRSILKIADYCYVISLGRVQLEGKPDDLMVQNQLKKILLGGA